MSPKLHIDQATPLGSMLSPAPVSERLTRADAMRSELADMGITEGDVRDVVNWANLSKHNLQLIECGQANLQFPH